MASDMAQSVKKLPSQNCVVTPIFSPNVEALKWHRE